MRCEGWRRIGGAFGMGLPVWSQCENEASVEITATQDGQTKTFPACQVCCEEAVEHGIEIVSVRPILAAEAAKEEKDG